MNENPGIPNFAATIDAKVWKILSGVHTCIPGEIVTFDGNKASVQPSLSATFKTNENGDKVQRLPIISGVPVIYPRWQNGGVFFPLSKGDTGLVVFSERSLDEWLNGGGVVAPEDPRKFDLSDAIFLPGLVPLSQINTLYENDSLVLSHDGNSIKIKDDGKITAKCDEFIIDGKLRVKNDATFETETITGPTQIKGTLHKHTTLLGPTIPPIIPQ